MPYERLRGTADEAEALRLILMLKPKQVLLQQKATEAAVKRLRAPRVLHIATHGFFEQDEVNSAPPAFSSSLFELQTGMVGENPLLRSGLALAGANQLKSGLQEDGILAALEVSGLDLWGTRLVVLSACETGVGQVQTGEGVYGLRRALVLAGAEAQVMSLWKVDDTATKQLMVAYYDKLVRQHIGRADALRLAQLSMLDDPKRQHPYYWAAFIHGGAWGTIQ
jgi:CHAT domain-containing protein